jgi:hypothetical protein
MSASLRMPGVRKSATFLGRFPRQGKCCTGTRQKWRLGVAATPRLLPEHNTRVHLGQRRQVFGMIKIADFSGSHCGWQRS